MFSPTKSAPLEAVKNGHIITWPGLTEQEINKHLTLTPVTSMGHINQCRQNIRYTYKKSITSDMEDEAVTPAGLETKTHLVYAVVVDQGHLYTDLTGKSPVRSSNGNWYVMVYYPYDCNYVKYVPMKSRSASEWIKPYNHIHKELTSKGFRPKLQTLDNEASAALKSLSPQMTWSINSLLPTDIETKPLKGPFKLSKNILSQDWHQRTHIFHYVYRTDCYHKQN
jgi:hypothetical protein